MSRTLTIITAIFLVCVVLASLGGLLWVNMLTVHNLPVEKDFLVPWLGARTFLQYGESPYGDPATQRAQINYYGRLAAQDQDPLVLWLPLPVELFYFPIALVNDYNLARSIWMTCLEIVMAIMAFLTLQLSGWRPGRLIMPIVLLFPLLWVYGAFSLVAANSAGFVALALVVFLLALRDERDELAGGLLILLVSAARISGVLAFFVIWWVIYRRRWRVLWGFLMGTVILLGLAFLFLPGWFMPFLRGLVLHFTYNPGLTSTNILASWSPVVGLRLSWLLTACLLLMLFLEWGNALKKDFRAFLWAASLTLSVTPLLGIPMIPAEYSFLFIPLSMFLAILTERRTWIGRWAVGGMILLGILAGSWYLTLALLSANNYTTLADILTLLLPALLVSGLYWMRWWFNHNIPTGIGTPR